ncbi:MAG: NAD(+)--rifampin ADP-ribosyltransferase [Gemmatimonadetes bacterium]|nr:NAD(+)--rifampin ADP-ribosyltransferase [Gemmatimonadota bacterium]
MNDRTHRARRFASKVVFAWEIGRPWYHGTRADLLPGDVIEPGAQRNSETSHDAPGHVYLTPDLDGAIWGAELASGEGHPRVYVVEPLGPVEDAVNAADWLAPGHPSMSWRSGEPLRVAREVTEWSLYHGTRADFRPGDLIVPGRPANFGETPRTSNHVYLTRTLDAAKWGAELSSGEGRGRIYIVEPTGPLEDDPNVTDKKFRGNPTKSFRSREALRVIGELEHWTGHPVEAVRAMKDGLARLEAAGKAVIDD